MKAHIFKPDNTNESNRYYIEVEPEGVNEELALEALSHKIHKGYAEVTVDVMGIGTFIKYGTNPK